MQIVQYIVQLFLNIALSEIIIYNQYKNKKGGMLC